MNAEHCGTINVVREGQPLAAALRAVFPAERRLPDSLSPSFAALARQSPGVDQAVSRKDDR